jgi:hypothetical protein
MEENRKINFFSVLSIDRLDSKLGWPEEFMMMGGKHTAPAECFRHRSLNVRETNYCAVWSTVQDHYVLVL